MSVMILVPFLVLAQGTPLTDLFDRYAVKPGYESSQIQPGAVNYEWEKEMDISGVKEMMKDIEKIRILKYKHEEDKAGAENLWRKMQKAASSDLYTEIATVNAENIQVDMYMIKGVEGVTREIAILEKDAGGVMMLTVTGNMNFSEMFSPENMKNLREMGEYMIGQKGSCDRMEQ